MAFDWHNPDYAAVYAERAARLVRIRERPELLPGLREHYRTDPASFISDWGVTSDPRAKAFGRPVEMPFVLFDRQREMIGFVLDRMRAREPGIIEKSRDCGASWLIVCLATTLCLFEPGTVVGFGSSKEDKIDRSGDPDSLFWKARFFLSHLPPEFRGNWDESRHSAHMRIAFPDSGSAIVGEAGDEIGRGGRSSLYIIDESAHLERPQLIEASLASNTLSRIDVSTPAGRANAFAEKRFSGRVPVFSFRWQSDPRKGPEWYRRQCELLDPVTRAQEIDLSYDASVEGILIPTEWVQAAIDAHRKLGTEISGSRRAALDVADEGRDKCAFIGRHGVLIEHAEQWSGRNGDIYQTTIRAINTCEQHGYGGFDYDADGLGAGVRGDAVQVNLQRRATGKREIEAEPFRGSGAVYDPDGEMVEGRTNRDFFSNLKAQAWWALRLRFQATHRAVVEGMQVHPDEIISIDPNLSELTALTVELSQPTYSVNSVGRIVVDKAPDGTASPNLADAVMIAFAPLRPSPLIRADAMLQTRPDSPMREPVEPPEVCDAIFASVAAGLGAELDALGMVVGAFKKPSQLWVLDWGLLQIESGTLAGLWAMLEQWCESFEPRCHAIYGVIEPLIEPAGTGAILCEQARQQDIATMAIDSAALSVMTLPQRVVAASAYLHGGSVLLTRAAHEQVTTHKGITRNHLLHQLAAFGAEQQPEPGVLLAALSNAVLAALVEKP